MKILNPLFTLMLVTLIGISFSSCSDDDEPMTNEPQTIAEIVTDNEDFSSLLAALNKADLAGVLNGTDQFTVFAPRNDAFSAFLNAKGFANLDAVPAPTLTQILLNHVVAGNVKSTDLTTGYASTLATEASSGNNLSLYVDISNGVQLNGAANVISADIAASNGTIHIVDEVIDLPSIVTFATTNPAFSTLVAALTRQDFGSAFVDLLGGSEGGPFTVFAPTNEAFGDLLVELGAGGLGDIETATLDAVLKYHVVGGANVTSSMLSNNMEVATVGGSNFTVNLSADIPQIIDARDRQGNIVVTDVQAANGVIHVIDMVILP